MSLHHIIKKGMKAAFYARHSTAKQNIETQRAFVKKFIESYECIKIEDEYLDENVSARKNKIEDRKELVRLLDDISSEKFNFVVVYQQDRLSRDPSEHIFLRSLFNQANIPIVVASTHTLYDSGDLLTNIFRDGLSQYEVETLRIRTRDTLATLHSQGLWTGGKPPFGYKYISKMNPLEPDEYELSVVKDIFRFFIEKLGLKTIATLMNKKYYNKMSKPFLTKQRIKSVLLNPIYAGRLIHRKGKDIASWNIVETDLICKPLMTFDEWSNIYTLYLKRQTEDKNNIISQTQFYLRGLLYCGTCHQKLQHKNQINSKGYGNLWYFCKSSTCNYKLEATDIHLQCTILVNVLLDDLCPDLLEHASLKRQQLIQLSVQQLNKVNHEIKKAEDLLQTIDSKINNAATGVTNIFKNFDNTQQLTIVDMLKSYRKKIEETHHNLFINKAEIKRTKKMYESSDFISQILKELSSNSLDLNANDLNVYQRLIIQLVEKITIIPVGLINKKRVLDEVELEVQLNNT